MSELREELNQLTRKQLLSLIGKDFFDLKNKAKLSTAHKHVLVSALMFEMKKRKMWFVPTEKAQMNFDYGRMTDEQLRNMLQSRGVKYVPPKDIPKENLIRLLSADECDIDLGEFCSNPQESCDVDNKICIKPGETGTENIKESFTTSCLIDKPPSLCSQVQSC